MSQSWGNLIGAGVGCGQPAEEAFIGGGRVLAGGPVPRHVVRVRDHQLSSVEVSAQNEGDVLHPLDDGSSLRGHLKEDKQGCRRWRTLLGSSGRS